MTSYSSFFTFRFHLYCFIYELNSLMMYIWYYGKTLVGHLFSLQIHNHKVGQKCCSYKYNLSCVNFVHSVILYIKYSNNFPQQLVEFSMIELYCGLPNFFRLGGHLICNLFIFTLLLRNIFHDCMWFKPVRYYW